MNQFCLSSLELVYRGSRDGMKGKAFHAACDNKGATITLCYSNYGHVFGGFTNVPWSSAGGYQEDKGAFLFMLKSKMLTQKDYNDVGGKVFRLKDGQEKS